MHILPTPIVFENFNSTAEGSLPAGWTAINLDGVRNPTSEPEINFTNLDSAAYTNWTTVEAYRFTNLFSTYSQEYNGGTTDPGEASDYHRVLTVNPSNVVNGVFVRSLATGRFVFGDSGYRNDSLGQIVYLFSPDFNLTGQSNVYLSFHSLYEQNQDSIGSAEYSIDMGTNWLPIAYLLQGFADGNPSDVLTNGSGQVDAELTFSTNYTDVAKYMDSGNTLGGFYGAFIGAASNTWSTLAPYLQRRINDDPAESKRVEIFRLPLADNQPKVRLRFAYAGTDSWYWGIDDVGLYSLPPLKITSIVKSGSNVVISWNGAAGTKLQRATTLSAPIWQDVAGSNGASTATEPIATAGYYRLVRPY